MSWVGCQPRVELRKKANKNTSNETTCSKLSAVVATANFQQKEWNEKEFCGFLSEIESEKRFVSCSQ